MVMNKSKFSSKSRKISTTPRLYVTTRHQEDITVVKKVRPLKRFRRHSTRGDICPGTLSHRRHVISASMKGRLASCRQRKGTRCDPTLTLLPKILDLKWHTGFSAGYTNMNASMRPIQKFIYQLSEYFEYDLQIPSDWNVFKNVNCDDLPKWFPTRDTLRSNVSDLSSGSSDTSSSSSSSQQPSVSAVCQSRELTDSRTRNQWNFISTIMPAQFLWGHQTRERALHWNAQLHIGFFDMNQSCLNQDFWPQVAAHLMLSYWEADDYGDLLPLVREVSHPCTIGRILVGLVQTAAFPAQYKKTLRWPRRISLGEEPPIIDYLCRATPEATGWEEDMYPLLFAAQFHTLRNRHDTFESMELAAIFRQMISLLILYYLDTRTSAKDHMPPWMMLFGITYNPEHVIVWGHTPWSQKNDRGESRWNAKIWNISGYQRSPLRFSAPHRGPLMSMLNRIQGHCVYVLEQLKAWNGYDRARQLRMA